MTLGIVEAWLEHVDDFLAFFFKKNYKKELLGTSGLYPKSRENI